MRLKQLLGVLIALLLAGSIDPTRGWLITLVVVTGLAALVKSKAALVGEGRAGALA